jgi:hypothetical protein
VLPVLSLLYLMNGLDRSNVGNAAVSNICVTLLITDCQLHSGRWYACHSSEQLGVTVLYYVHPFPALVCCRRKGYWRSHLDTFPHGRMGSFHPGTCVCEE